MEREKNPFITWQKYTQKKEKVKELSRPFLIFPGPEVTSDRDNSAKNFLFLVLDLQFFACNSTETRSRGGNIL